MPEISPSRYLVQATWENSAPHLTEEAKEELLRSYLPHTRDARSKGHPSLGAGAIYPIEPSAYKVPSFLIPRHWPRGYAMDVGWKVTASLWGARDPETDVIYVFAEYYGGQREPSTHATAIKARGDWMQGVIDPASRGRSQVDGQKLIENYREAGLLLSPAKNAVEAGIYAVYERLATGRLKVFNVLAKFWEEISLYRRDPKDGQVVKEFDHLMDCLRYLILNWESIFRVQPVISTSGTGAILPADSSAGY